MHPLPFLELDPQESSARTEDSTAYWFSEALFTAVELMSFGWSRRGTADRWPRSAWAGRPGSRTFSGALRHGAADPMRGFVLQHPDRLNHLVQGRRLGHSILWRKALSTWGSQGALRAGGRVYGPASENSGAHSAHHRYIHAMNDVARVKAGDRALLEIFPARS